MLLLFLLLWFLLLLTPFLFLSSPPPPLKRKIESASKRAFKAKDANFRKRQTTINEHANKKSRTKSNFKPKKNKKVSKGSEVFVPYWLLIRSSSINNLETTLTWMRSILYPTNKYHAKRRSPMIWWAWLATTLHRYFLFFFNYLLMFAWHLFSYLSLDILILSLWYLLFLFSLFFFFLSFLPFGLVLSTL